MPYVKNWEAIQEAFEAWWAHELGRPIVQVYYPGPSGRAFDFWCFLRHKDNPDALKRELEDFPETVSCLGDAFPTLLPNLGPGSLAAYFSGYLHFDHFNSTAWFEDPQPWDVVEKMAFDQDGDWWRYTLAVNQLAADMGRNRFLVGVTDIGGILDVLASLRGAENLLRDLLHEPDRVDVMRERIIEAWHRVDDALTPPVAAVQDGSTSWLKTWSAGRSSPLQCDFCAMISPAMFERFVAPDVQEQSRRLDHTIFHLDGPGQIPHVDVLLDIPELDGIQWVPGDAHPPCESPRWFPMYEKILRRGKVLLLQFFKDLSSIPQMLEALPHERLMLTVGASNEHEATDFLRTARPDL